ncbi:MAG: ABC transporter substrate-binding protein [Gammaproteobacteria bacterium]|nr:ABC transporter substrate-binding protein [Gammaproteobacteria bacterium]
MTAIKTLILAAGVAALALGQVGCAENAPGVTDMSIKIGNTNPYSGPASSYSTIGKSIGAFFKMVNENGGVNGRQIEWISVDDGYSPPKTKEQFRKLVEREKVAFMFQSLGTPTNSAVHRYMNKKKVPHLFVATGATKWGDPKNFPWTMGFQPNYQTMGKIFGGYVLQNHPDGKIGILYQNDDYGKDYVIGLRAALGDKADTMIVAEESYEVTDPTIDSQIVNLKASGANIFYNVSIPKFAAQAIKKVHDIGWRPVHLLNDVSNSVASVLKPAGLDKSQDILSTAYLKDPTDPSWKDDAEFKQWQAFMDEYYPDGDKTNPFNGYGYAVASLMVHVLEQCGDDLSRENIMQQAASVKDFRLKMALPGIDVNTGEDDFFPLEQAQMMRFKGESWERFGALISADSL